eukprot:1310408-Amphidinium_carterae.1
MAAARPHHCNIQRLTNAGVSCRNECKEDMGHNLSQFVSKLGPNVYRSRIKYAHPWTARVISIDVLVHPSDIPNQTFS